MVDAPPQTLAPGEAASGAGTGVRLTIVIPVFDMDSALGDAVDAAVREIGAGDEIIVVDDGSADASASVAAARPVRLVRLAANSGREAARLAGARAGRGRFVLFTDADAELQPGAVEALLAPLATGRADVAVGVYSAATAAPDLVSRFKNAWIRHTFLQTSDRISFPFGCISAMSRELFVDASDAVGWRDDLEDFALGAELQGRGVRFRFVPAAEVLHKRRFDVASLLANDFGRARAGTHLLLNRFGVGSIARQRRFANIGPEYAVGALVGCSALGAAALGHGGAGVGLALAYLAINASLLRALQRDGGLRLAGAGVLLLALSQGAALAGGLDALLDMEKRPWARSR